jgi:hypothetical protein
MPSSLERNETKITKNLKLLPNLSAYIPVFGVMLSKEIFFLVKLIERERGLL